MADTIIRYSGPSGLTLTLELYPSDSDTIGNTGGDSFTEATNAKGFYTATVTEALTGNYRVVIKSGSTVIDNGWVYALADDTSTYEVQATVTTAHIADAIWVEDIGSASGITPNSSGGILSKLASTLQLGDMAYQFTPESFEAAQEAISDENQAILTRLASAVAVQSPVYHDQSTGIYYLEITQGDSFDDVLQGKVTIDAGQDVSGATVTGKFYDGDGTLEATVTGSVSGQNVYLPITTAESASLTTGNTGTWEVELTSGSSKWTPVKKSKSVLVVLPD